MSSTQVNEIHEDVGHWCHVCSTSVEAYIPEGSYEYQCRSCGSNFVEALGQDVASFLRPEDPIEPSSAGPVNMSGTPAVGQLGTLLSGPMPAGRVHSRDAQHSLLQNISGTGGRPLGVLLYSGLFPGMLPGNSGSGNGGSLDDLIHHLMMTETSHRSYGALQTAIDSLERIYITDRTDIAELGPCGISMDDFETGDVAVQLPCAHVYKEELIVKWLKSHHTCPTCRYELAQEG